MAFPQTGATQLLAKCHRRCCICHRFCGFKMELDHIVPKADQGPDDIENAIAVCFECHAEIHAYNDQHPRGRKYRPEELRLHREQWLAMCTEAAIFLASVPSRTDVGPLQALIDELEFNQVVASFAEMVPEYGSSAPFEVAQFRRCMSEGILSLLTPDLKASILGTYRMVLLANTLIENISAAVIRGAGAPASIINNTRTRLREAQPLIENTLSQLSAVLHREQ